MIIFLKELCDDTVDGVIITKTSTKEDISCAITKVKTEYPESYQWEDIIEALPEDCEVHSRWDLDCESVYY